MGVDTGPDSDHRLGMPAQDAAATDSGENLAIEDGSLEIAVHANPIDIDGGLEMPPAPANDGLEMPPAPVDSGLEMLPAPVDSGLEMPAAPVDSGLEMPATPGDGGLEMPAAPADGGLEMPAAPADGGLEMPAAPGGGLEMPAAPGDGVVEMRAGSEDPSHDSATEATNLGDVVAMLPPPGFSLDDMETQVTPDSIAMLDSLQAAARLEHTRNSLNRKVFPQVPAFAECREPAEGRFCSSFETCNCSRIVQY